MFRVFHASTYEIDDPQSAVEEILSQVNSFDLLENSVGIIGCNLDYILNGTIEQLAESLPFETVGGTTNISDICGEAGEDQLALMILSSDQVAFACGITQSMVNDPDKSVKGAYDECIKAHPGNPTMGIAFAPYLLSISGDAQLRALDKATGGIPIFGTLALDYVNGVRDPRTVCNGKDYQDCMSFLLIFGDIEPQFFIMSISEERFLKQKAIVTSSEENILKEVNGIPAADYIGSLGFAKEQLLESIPLMPVSVDEGSGGRSYARALFAVTPEGYVICGGDIPEKAILGIGSIDTDEVQRTSKEVANSIVGAPEGNGALIFSCLARNRTLGLEPMLEIEEIQSVLGDDIPYLFMYSATELFPDIMQGQTINRAHNHSIVACVF